jgi:cell division protein ZapA
MADVTVDIGGNSYTIACREGEEAHLRGVAGLVDRKANEAREAVGGVSEVRQLLFASLLLADELTEVKQSSGLVAPQAPAPTADPALAIAVENIATRVEALANRLENLV